MSYPTPPPTPPQGGGRNWGKIALFGCLGLLVLGIVVTVIGAAAYYMLRDREGGAGGDGETVLYRSLDHTFTGVRAENLIDFSFHYPAHWRVTEDENADTPNYVKIENMNEDNITIENLAVGYISGDVQVPAVLDQLLEQLAGQFSAGLPNFQRVASGPATLAGKQGREITFTGRFDNPEGEAVDYYGRAMLIPATQDRGVAVIAIATELADGVDGPAQVGERGELAAIFDSFQIGGAAPGSATTPATTTTGQGGEVYEGVLITGDSVRDDGTLYDSYTVELTAGTQLTVTLTSTDFDAYLTVFAPSGQAYSDDDGAGGTDSRVSTLASESGTWTIWANAFRSGESGSYTLTINR